MKRCALIAACILLASSLGRAGEVIDGIVAVVNRVAILQSDWDDAVRFEALLQGRAPDTANAAERRAALDRLIDRSLIQQQLRAGRYPEAEAPEVTVAIAAMRSQIAPGLADDAWRARLAAYGLTAAGVETLIRRQVEQLGFVETRFRSAAHVGDAEIEQYYREEFLPQLRRAGGEARPLSEVRSRIEELLVEQRVNTLLAAWLQGLRSQAQIVMKDPALRGAPPGALASAGAPLD